MNISFGNRSGYRSHGVGFRYQPGPVASGALAVAGVGVAIFGWWFLQRAKASAEWPSVAGTVVRSGIEEERRSKTTSSGRRRYEYRYEPQISYAYTVEGTKYQGDRVAFSDKTFASKSSAEDFLKQHIADTKVFYDPDDPEEAVLVVGTSGGSYIWLIVGIVGIVLGGGNCLYMQLRGG